MTKEELFKNEHGVAELDTKPKEKPKCENCGSTDVIGRYPLGGYHCGKDECLPF